MPDDAMREHLGRTAHDAYVAWLAEQPRPWASEPPSWEERLPAARESYRRIGEAVAAFAAEHCAQAVLAHMETHGPKERGSAWRRHLLTASRVAAGAFMTREEMLAGAVKAIQRGEFVVCPSLQSEAITRQEDT